MKSIFIAALFLAIGIVSQQKFQVSEKLIETYNGYMTNE